MMVAGGMAFCKVCAKRSSTAGTLHDECDGLTEPRSNAERVRNRLLKGRYPDFRDSDFWPNGAPASTHQQPVRLALRDATTAALQGVRNIDWHWIWGEDNLWYRKVGPNLREFRHAPGNLHSLDDLSAAHVPSMLKLECIEF